MEILTYKIFKFPNEYEAICMQYPHVTWIADTKEEALEGVQEAMFRFFLEKCINFNVTYY